MDEMVLEAIREGGSIALALLIFFYYRKDAKETRDTIAALKENAAKREGLNREALIDSIRTQEQLIAVVENDVKVSEKVLERMDGR